MFPIHLTFLLAVIAGNLILSRKHFMTSVLLFTYNIIVLFSEINNNVRSNFTEIHRGVIST